MSEVEETVMETTEEVSEQVEPGAPASDDKQAEMAPASEDTDVEAQLAAEALADDDGGDDEQKVPVSVVAELRAQRRELRTANQQLVEALNNTLAERQKAAEPPQLSPEETFIRENAETFDPDTEPFPASVQIAQRRWEKEQQTRQTQQQSQAQRTQQGETSLANARATFSDYDDVIDMGKNYLTPGNKLDIQMSSDPAKTAYTLCMKATLAHGTPEDKALMRQNLKAKLTKTKPPSPQTQKKVDKGTGTQIAAGPAERMSPQLAHVYDAMGL